MMVQKRRIIEQVISKVFYENLLSLDLSYLLPDMARLNDAFPVASGGSYSTYVEHTPSVWRRSRSEPEPRVEPKPIHGSAEQFEAIIESAMDAIISVDAQQRVVLFNRGAEQVFGCSAAEAMGKPLDQFIPNSSGKFIATTLIGSEPLALPAEPCVRLLRLPGS